MSRPLAGALRPDPPGLLLRPRSALVLGVASLAGVLMFVWPLLVRVRPDSDAVQPPFVFMLLLPVVIVVCLAEFTEGGMDSKVLAVLAVLTAVNAVMRGLSAGVGGIELVFFLLVLGGRVFGAGFGFVLGCTSLFASALLTGGVGSWLPFQMMASAWVGMGAGLLPRRLRGRPEVAVLVLYGVAAAYLFGLAMNLTSWPFALGVAVPGYDGAAGLAFVPGDPVLENLRRFGVYTLLTSTGSWDTGRAVTTAVALGVLGPAVLATLRRAVRRATVVRVGPADAGAAAGADR
ncbi:ECF transporter S component [Nocardioides aurantiacus]|uniref:ECF transporter S component n=1 Tax=Nocardioides aurantiacus TaxID=86796 RepID=UPI00403F0D06